MIVKKQHKLPHPSPYLHFSPEKHHKTMQKHHKTPTLVPIIVKSLKITQFTPPLPPFANEPQKWRKNNAKTSIKHPSFPPQLSKHLKNTENIRKYSCLKIHTKTRLKTHPNPLQLSNCIKKHTKNTVNSPHNCQMLWNSCRLPLLPHIWKIPIKNTCKTPPIVPTIVKNSAKHTLLYLYLMPINAYIWWIMMLI